LRVPTKNKMLGFKMATVIGLFLITATSAYSQSVCSIAANVYFINGVNKPSEKEVIKSAELLEQRIDELATQKNGVLSVTHLYNDSDGLLLDVLYKLAAQKSAERNWIVADTFVTFGLAAFEIFTPISEEDKLEAKRSVARTIASTLPKKTQELITKFSDKVYAESLANNTQAILVPHSQGNMFANSMYENLKLNLPKNLFRGLAVVNIASPAAVAPSGFNLTAFQDTVINLLATGLSLVGLTFPPMAANFDANGSLKFDPLGHGFAEVYMNPSLPEGTQLDNSIVSAIINMIDVALYKTSTFLDTPNFYYDAAGLKQPRPSWMPADSTSTTVCFPGPIGGL
jgi:hypothetical protein